MIWSELYTQLLITSDVAQLFVLIPGNRVTEKLYILSLLTSPFLANSDLYDIHCIFIVHPSCAPGIIYDWAIVDSGPKAG